MFHLTLSRRRQGDKTRSSLVLCIVTLTLSYNLSEPPTSTSRVFMAWGGAPADLPAQRSGNYESCDHSLLEVTLLRDGSPNHDDHHAKSLSTGIWTLAKREEKQLEIGMFCPMGRGRRTRRREPRVVALNNGPVDPEQPSELKARGFPS